MQLSSSAAEFHRAFIFLLFCTKINKFFSWTFSSSALGGDELGPRAISNFHPSYEKRNQIGKYLNKGILEGDRRLRREAPGSLHLLLVKS